MLSLLRTLWALLGKEHQEMSSTKTCVSFDVKCPTVLKVDDVLWSPIATAVRRNEDQMQFLFGKQSNQ